DVCSSDLHKPCKLRPRYCFRRVNVCNFVVVAYGPVGKHDAVALHGGGLVEHLLGDWHAVRIQPAPVQHPALPFNISRDNSLYARLSAYTRWIDLDQHVRLESVRNLPKRIPVISQLFPLGATLIEMAPKLNVFMPENIAAKAFQCHSTSEEFFLPVVDGFPHFSSCLDCNELRCLWHDDPSPTTRIKAV